VKELQNFIRKYYLTAELLIFKYKISWFPIPQPVWQRLYFSTGQRSCPQGTWDRAAVNLWNTRLHRSISVASQQSWPEPGRPPDWGKLQERVYCSQVHDVGQLMSRLIEEWEHFHQVFIDEAISQWRPRLRACIWAHRGHYDEQRLQLCL